MIALLVFVVAGLAVYACRSVFILVIGDRHLPAQVERSLSFVGPVVLAALITSYLTADRGAAAFARDLPAVLGTVAGIVVARWRRTFLSAFVAAVATYWITAAIT